MNKKILFIHVGKCGGGSICNIIQKNNLGKYIRYEHVGYKLQKNLTQDHVIACTREPAERFVSAFNWRRLNVRHNCSKEELKILDYYQMPNNLAEALSHPKESRRHRAEDAMASLGHIKQPFAQYFGGVAMLRALKHHGVKFYEIRTQLLPWHIKQADYLTDDTKLVLRETLKRAYNLDVPIKIPKRAKSTLGRHRKIKPQQKTHVGFQEANKVFLSDTAINNLEDWYERDYECLKYFNEIKEKGLRRFF